MGVVDTKESKDRECRVRFFNKIADRTRISTLTSLLRPSSGSIVSIGYLEVTVYSHFLYRC
jgi:hypothetical protein